MYKHLFGPVPSRRLGMSLGIDLVPRKVCSFDCVYCEVGATTLLTLKKKEYILLDKIKEELERYFKENPDPDFITFSGSGEPTLNSRIGEVIRYVRQVRESIPVAVLTNGSMLHTPDVRHALLDADVVLPSLDAATQAVFEKINRPVKGLTIEAYIQGIVDFRQEFKGKMWLEVFILPGYNDAEKELIALKKAIRQINPDSVQLNTLDRPGTVAGLQGATREELESVISLWGLEGIEIISAAPQRKKVRSYRTDAEAAIMDTIARRPCTIDDVSEILGMHISEINKYLDVLEAEGKIESKEGSRGIFYQLKTGESKN